MSLYLSCPHANLHGVEIPDHGNYEKSLNEWLEDLDVVGYHGAAVLPEFADCPDGLPFLIYTATPGKAIMPAVFSVKTIKAFDIQKCEGY